MTRTLYRHPALRRFVSSFVALAFTLSLTGVGYASPTAATPAGQPVVAVEASATPEPVVTPPQDPAPTNPAQADPAPKPDPAPSVVASPTTTDPAPVQGGKDKRVGSTRAVKTADATVVAPLAVAPALIAGGPTGAAVQFSLEGYNLAQGKWTPGNLGADYQEGDWVPHRMIIDNTGGSDPYVVPSFALELDHFNSTKDAVMYDLTGSWGYLFTGSTASSDPFYPGGLTSLSPASQDVPEGGFTDKNAPHIYTSFGAGALTVPAGQMGVVYFKGHLALTPYWNYYGPGIDGAGFYPGSSGQTRISMEGVGDKTVPLPSIPEPTGSITVVKFNDLNQDGVRDAGEPPMSGWTFHLSMVSGFPLDATAVTDANGEAVFTPLPGASYSITEDQQSGWTASTDLPVAVTLSAGEDVSIDVGNYRPAVTKTFSLSISNLPAGATAFVSYVVAGQSHELALAGSGPFTASVELPYGTTIESWTFFAKLAGGAEIALGGSSEGETLTGPMTNSLRYSSSVSGMKYADADADGLHGQSEVGLAGWTIQLKRVVGEGEVLYAQTITGAGGTYTFADVLPGTYAVYEVDQSGWFNTAAPTGTFTVSNGSEITGLNFGNVQVLSGISVVKSGPDIAYVGDVITYLVTVSNAGNTALHDVVVTDTMFGVLDTGLALAVGESKSYTLTHTVTAEDPDPLPNVVTAMGFDLLGGPVADEADHSVDILKPGLSVAKTGPVTAYVGDTVTYTITVSNTGSETLYNVVVSDPALAWSETIGTMAAGEVLVFHPTLVLTAETPDPLPNTVTVTGSDQTEKTYTDNDSHEIDILKPSISVLKSGPDFAYVGDTITYTITVMNDGEDPLYNVTALDEMLGWSQSYLVLLPGETHVYQVEHVITAETPDPLPNTVTVTGSDPAGNPVNDEATHLVDIVKPAISIVKSSDADAAGVPVGTLVTYTYVVKNVGEEPLAGIIVTDDKLGAVNAEPFSLLPGEEKTLTLSVALDASVTNVATAVGIDPHQREVTASDNETVEVFLPFTPPDLSLAKSADKSTAKPGDLVTYTLVITNVGQGASQGYTVVDDYDQRYVTEVIDAGGGDVDTSTGKITWEIAEPLAPGASKTLTYTVKISASMPAGTTIVRNTAVAIDPTDEVPGNNVDTWEVKVAVSEPFLPFTGVEYYGLIILAMAAAIIGVLTRRLAVVRI